VTTISETLFYKKIISLVSKFYLLKKELPSDIVNLLRNKVNLDLFAKEAVKLQLFPCLYKHPDVPNKIKKIIKPLYIKNLAKNLYLIEILSRLKKQKIITNRFIAVKGLSNLTLYSPDLRFMTDVDFFIADDSVLDTALRINHTLKGEIDFKSRFQHAQIKFSRYNHIFFIDISTYLIDTKIPQFRHLKNINKLKWLNKFELFEPVGNFCLKRFKPGIRFLIAAIHTLKHSFSSFVGLFDMFAIFQNNPDIIKETHNIASKYNLLPQLKLCISLMNYFFDLQLKDEDKTLPLFLMKYDYIRYINFIFPLVYLKTPFYNLKFLLDYLYFYLFLYKKNIYIKIL